METSHRLVSININRKPLTMNLITKPLNNRLLEIMPSYDLKFSRAELMMQAEDTS